MIEKPKTAKPLEMLGAINHLIDAINEMSEGCEHYWIEYLGGKKCKYCGKLRNLEHGDVIHTAPENKQEGCEHRHGKPCIECETYEIEEKQEDEEMVTVIVTGGTQYSGASIERCKTIPKSEARRLGLI